MDPFFDDTVVRDLVEATAGALDAGADPAAVYGLVSETCTQCVDYMSQELHNTLMQRECRPVQHGSGRSTAHHPFNNATPHTCRRLRGLAFMKSAPWLHPGWNFAGMHPDTLIDRFNGKTVLHELLGRTHPPALVAGLDWEGVPQTTLEEVLDRHERLGPDPHLDRPPSNRASAGTDMAWAASLTRNHGPPALPIHQHACKLPSPLLSLQGCHSRPAGCRGQHSTAPGRGQCVPG